MASCSWAARRSSDSMRELVLAREAALAVVVDGSLGGASDDAFADASDAADAAAEADASPAVPEAITVGGAADGAGAWPVYHQCSSAWDACRRPTASSTSMLLISRRSRLLPPASPRSCSRLAARRTSASPAEEKKS